MNRHLKILMAGALLVVPLVATVWVVCWIGTKLGAVGYDLLDTMGLVETFRYQWLAGLVGVVIVVAGIYAIGLLANFWLFRKLFALLDHLLSVVPGVKTIYESVRDLMKLFGGGGKAMGYAVVYTDPATKVKRLGIVTNEHPQGLPPGDDSVIVYLPMGYMIGGPIVYASPADIERIDMPVEVALKLAATAFVGSADEEKEKTDK
jgi:uncharacterized membrane protein